MKLLNEYYLDLISELTKKEIKVRYKNSYLGYLWSIANPLMLSLVFYFVFKIVTKVQMENYALFLISGLFFWQWVSNSIIAGSTLYISNSSLIKKVNFPRYFLVVALILSEGFNFLLSILVIIGFAIYYNQNISLIWLIGIPTLFIISAIFIFSFSLLVATINLFFRDMERLITIFLTFIFYMTPIIYPIKMIPQSYHWSLYINIFTPFVINWRELFLHNQLNLKYITISLLYSIISIIISFFIYNKLKYKFAELV